MSEESKQNKLKMEVSLGTIDDLGVKLYSGFPAAIAELVANAWDADAERVDIDISDKKIVIKDDGHGMNRDDIQKKYLTVGYRRRDAGERQTPKYKRAVMGRKGIGRLALFAIANQVKVLSAKNDEKIGLELSYPDIKKEIEEGEGIYIPKEINVNEIKIDCGTKIELTKFRHKSKGLQQHLKARLARRFSIIGKKYHFKVFVDNEEVSVSDRNYYRNIQELWTFGSEKEAEAIKAACSQCQHKHLDNSFDNDKKISGWIGAVSKVGLLKQDNDNLNNIAIMMRGRLAQEDILHSLGKGEIAVKYLIGEIHADYLDDDNEDDMATSGRQKLNENDERYEAIKNNIKKLVTRVCSEWHDLRGKKAKEDILSKNEEIKKWYNTLSPDAKKVTDRLFKDTRSIDDERKKNLIRCIVPAVEQMSMRSNLNQLNEISLENLEQFSKIFQRQDDIEAVSYYRITQGRLGVINKLSEDVKNNTREKIIQKHIYDHLWLLDPSWERPCIKPSIEKRVKKRWKELDEKTGEEVEKIKELRLDIEYKMTSGQHVVIELKRPGRQLDRFDLLQQIDGYIQAVSDELKVAVKTVIM